MPNPDFKITLTTAFVMQLAASPELRNKLRRAVHRRAVGEFLDALNNGYPAWNIVNYYYGVVTIDYMHKFVYPALTELLDELDHDDQAEQLERNEQCATAL